MAPRKTSASIDPVQVIAIALKRCKTKGEYNRIAATNTEEDLNSAWTTLTLDDQTRVHNICSSTAEPDLKAIADELVTCGTLIQLQGLKAEHGSDVIKQVWKILPQTERDRLTAICKNEQEPVEETTPVTEQPASCQVESQPKTRTLFSIGSDLEKLNELLDEAGDDTQQKELIGQWFETLGTERERKLDNYAALITEMLARAEVRKAEAKRLQREVGAIYLCKSASSCFTNDRGRRQLQSYPATG